MGLRGKDTKKGDELVGKNGQEQPQEQSPPKEIEIEGWKTRLNRTREGEKRGKGKKNALGSGQFFLLLKT